MSTPQILILIVGLLTLIAIFVIRAAFALCDIADALRDLKPERPVMLPPDYVPPHKRHWLTGKEVF